MHICGPMCAGMKSLVQKEDACGHFEMVSSQSLSCREHCNSNAYKTLNAGGNYKLWFIQIPTGYIETFIGTLIAA